MGNLLGKGIDIRVFEYHTKTVLLFEGFLDFLSYLTTHQITEPPCTTVVLNSAIQLKRFITYVTNNPHIEAIEYFRDRDEAGVQTLKRLETHSPPSSSPINQICIYHITI